MVKRKMVRYVLIIPGLISVNIFAVIIWVRVSDFGPPASSHILSKFVAADWPKVRLAFGERRCIRAGK